MEATTIGNFDNKIKKFNELLKNNNLSQLSKVGKDIIETAIIQLAKSSNDVHSSRYEDVSKVALGHLINILNENLSDNITTDIQDSDSNTSKDPYFHEKNWFDDNVPDLGFKDIIGVQEVKEAFMTDIIAPIDDWFKEIFKKFRGNNLNSQYLLYGPPGTGKTHLVRCLAGELKAKIAVINTSEVLASVVGVGEKNMKSIFEQASKLDRCIVFLDEIDSLAAGRDNEDSRHTKSILTTLLTSLDGFNKNTNGQMRIVIAATNRPWVIDSALKRGGRFDTQIYVPLPEEDEIEFFINRALTEDGKNIPLKPEVDMGYLISKLHGLAGADILSILKKIANRPLQREILNIHNGRGIQGEAIERSDVEAELAKHINSTTPDMLIHFEAYKNNMSYLEYLEYISRKE